MNLIDEVELRTLTRHYDERGYFQENIKASDNFFVGFGQWSVSYMYHGTIKAFHIHKVQYDYWFCSSGVIKAVLCDLRSYPPYETWKDGDVITTPVFDEFYLGDDYPPAILKIPPGVAHGLKVLQGPAVLSYLTSQEYDPADEGRIPYNALGYDWFKQDIK